MANLPEELKNEIVLRLSRYEGYSDIARSISTEYDVSVTRFQVRSYDPTKPAFAAGDKWRDIFARERHKYITDIGAIPISHQAYRLNQLQRMLDKAIEARNFVLACKLVEQAAKEVGGALTKERTETLHDERVASYRSMTPEERRDLVGNIFQAALDADNEKKTEH